MGIIGIILLVIFVLCSLLLIGIVLIQDEQGEGIGGLFGGGSATPFGSRSGNILTRFTSVLGMLFLVVAFSLAWVNKTPETGDVLGAARRGAADEKTIQEWWLPDSETEESAADSDDTAQSQPASQE